MTTVAARSTQIAFGASTPILLGLRGCSCCERLGDVIGRPWKPKGHFGESGVPGSGVAKAGGILKARALRKEFSGAVLVDVKVSTPVKK